ncbi:TPA: response regulator transcription factor [Candidatus Scatousia excrementigallinarum]|uniref:Response regulator transcription factor n=1 Tax=Candidatus Scatousia excrementigallinarum TaxID=2840935 RepID=A0A9D1EXB5_9BACT|nr:response regulator transcription factor [Candidatus Scatousia excrementigallinarum]
MKLTPKETEVITLVASGFSDKEIGLKLNISYGTVRDYIDKIVLKTQARNRTHAAMLYAKENPQWLGAIR